MQRDNHPNLVSVVIPCYNGARYLALAIESCLKQTYKDIEIIVVDDASPDDCAKIAEGYVRSDDRVRLIRLAENGGVSRAFNVGFEAARGAYMTRLAQDDLFGPEAIASMKSRLVERPESGLTYCNYVIIDEHGEAIRETNLPGPGGALLPRNSMGLCVMWRRSVWDTIGGFDPLFDTAEDYEYWLRASALFPIVQCEGRDLFFARRHGEMGSIKYFARQERATIAALRSTLATGTWPQRITLRKATALAHFSAAHDYSIAGHQGVALIRIGRSLLLWPQPFRRSEIRTALARPKALFIFARRGILQFAVALKQWRPKFHHG